jgi:hypothetical protein
MAKSTQSIVGTAENIIGTSEVRRSSRCWIAALVKKQAEFVW